MNVDIDQHDAALRAVSKGKALHRLSITWALEDDYLCRCSAPHPIDGADGH
jgi:hypothetical protein